MVQCIKVMRESYRRLLMIDCRNASCPGSGVLNGIETRTKVIGPTGTLHQPGSAISIVSDLKVGIEVETIPRLYLTLQATMELETSLH
jgi:hypothetical protein